MTQKMKIDIVSDVVCPWCIIGWKSLSSALENLSPDLEPEIRWQPFELNPDMPAEGQDIDEHLMWKYGMPKSQAEGARNMIKTRGSEVGFTFNMEERSKIYNTFDAHRLLHWAHEIDPSKQHALKLDLFTAYFSQGKDPSNRDVLLNAVDAAGLDRAQATTILDSDRYADEVRSLEDFWRNNGIHSVPTFIINGKHAITGGQPADVFERALRQIATERQAASA